MSASNETTSKQPGKATAPPLDPALRERIERYRILRSAWTVLAPSSLSDEKRTVSALGRKLNEALKTLVGRRPAQVGAALLGRLDRTLDSFEQQMRAIALEVPLAQLRTTVPGELEPNRRGVLDLLDLILGAEIESLPGTEGRIPVVDYLIARLCTADTAAGQVALHDPVTLTPRLHAICDGAGTDYDPRLPQIEAEFFAAADMHEADVRSIDAVQSLTRRKMELGKSYFSPSVLRAIVTYNAALSQRIEDEAWKSQDWGSLPTDDVTSSGSVFECEAITELADAVRRRAAGSPPRTSPIDRIAWCLDLAYPDKSERAALLSENVGSGDNVVGTTILVGLLCRSANVLDAEFPEIGISPERLSGDWVPELDEALKREVSARLADDYAAACAISELKSRFLHAPMTEVHRSSRGQRPARTPVQSDRQVHRDAGKLAREALDRERDDKKGSALDALRLWPWARLGRIAGATAVAGVCALAVAVALLPAADLARYESDELHQLSPYLSRGERNGGGSGRAFVGTIDESWLALDASARRAAASDLVEALRARGVDQIMVYDADKRLRIQALGRRPAAILAAATP